MVPLAAASSTCRPGTISPAAKVSIVNLPSLMSLTNLATVGEAPHKPSMDFGKLDARRHLTACCAMAGDATATVLAAARRGKIPRDTRTTGLPFRGPRHFPAPVLFWGG